MRPVRLRDLGILVALMLLAAVTAMRSPQFATAVNLQRILLDISLLLIVATGQTLVILTRNIDLSVGSALGLVGITVGFYLKSNPDLGAAAILGLGVALGALLGSVNGFLVAWGRVPAIIATLGTLTIYRGLVFIQSGSQQVNPQDIPRHLIALARPSQAGLPWMAILAFAAAITAGSFLRYTRSGRAVYAIGSNPEAARMRGIPVDRIVFLVYVLSGGLAGLAGILYAARFATVNPASAGLAFELQAVAAAVIGGVSILGGSGGIPGAFLGSLFLGTLANALAVTGVSGFWQRAVEGAIILIAVSVDAAIRRREGRRVSFG